VVDLQLAYAHCAHVARQHYENFPVASFLLPSHARPHIAAVYAFARGADDLADEGHEPAADRLAALGRWREWLHAVAAGREAVDAGRDALVFAALGETMRVHGLPVDLFDDLLSAFSQDVVVTRYATWTDVLDYCRRSANPIGRLVLRVCGKTGPGIEAASDRVCTALQLTNFWQDLAGDWAAGRLYLPEDLWRSHGARLDAFNPAMLTPEWQAVLTLAAQRTRDLFNEGRAVCDQVSGRLRYELRVTWLGGMRILDRLERNAFDTVRRRPTLGAGDVLALGWGTLLWRRQA
jgi:phytoene synthase